MTPAPLSLWPSKKDIVRYTVELDIDRLCTTKLSVPTSLMLAPIPVRYWLIPAINSHLRQAYINLFCFLVDV